MAKKDKEGSDSKPMGLAEHAYRLSKDLEKAYDNPTLEALRKAAEDRQALLESATEQWKTPHLQRKIKEYEQLLKEPGLAAAFATQQDYEQYTKPLLPLLENEQYKAAQQAMQSLQPRIKHEYSAIESAIEQLQKTIGSSSIQKSLEHLANLGSYESSISKAVESISKNENLSAASKKLSELGKSLASDSFKQRMNDHAAENFRVMHRELPKIEIPENPLIGQNEQIIEISTIQNEMLKDISEQMRIQNEYTDLEIKELEKQNSIANDQIKDNRRSSRNAVIFAIVSILLSAVASYMSYKASYDIYTKEKLENDKDNKELLQTITESSDKSKYFSQLVQEMVNVNNSIVEDDKKQSQLLELIREQNILLKKLSEQLSNAKQSESKKPKGR